MKYPSAVWVGQTPNHSGKFKSGEPSLLVLHYDAGRAAKGAVDSMMDPAHKASAPIDIDHDGTVYQLSDLDLICWHAGKSAWKGRTLLNRYSIGIEHANLGFMKKVAGTWMTGASNFKSPYKGDPATVVVAAHKNDPKRVMGWEPYPEAQIASSLELCAWILKQFPTIKEIVGHDDISSGRKSDPGPAFPMQRFQALLGVASHPRHYTVKTGDTLWGISQALGRSEAELIAANGGSTVIRPGQVITV